MYTQESETSRYLKTFMRHLGKNKLGHPFIRLVSTSLDRKISHNQKLKLMGFKGDRKSESLQEKNKMKRAHTEAREDKILNSFRIKDGELGDSVHLVDFMKSKIEKKVLSRQITFEKGGSKLQSLVIDRKSLALQQVLRAREGYLKMNKLNHILTALTGNPNVSTLRIYKERLKKFYNARFLKEKITSFFDYEYIEDYDSQLGYIQTLLSLKLQEIYFLCFIVLDQDGDGLISNDDLFSLATASIKSNPLINKDIYKIFQYITYYQNQKTGIKINDNLSDEQYFKGQNITLQKYRLRELKSQKEKVKKLELQSEKKSWKTVQVQDSKGILLTRRTGKHLFSVRLEDNQGQNAIKELRKKFAQTQVQTSIGYNFKINFNRFKNIFIHNIPETYFDILYLVGEIRVPEKDYLELNFDIDDRPVEDEDETQPDRYGYYKEKVDGMRVTYRQSKIERLSTDSRSWRSAKKPN